ncbi:MAG: hypothetical protein ABIJ96_17280 [Elusimicrobiota bacterium]
MPAKKNGSKPATQADVQRLDKKIDRFGIEIVKTQDEIRTIKHDMKSMATKDDVSRILAAIDSFAQKGETYDRKALSHGHILSEHESKLRS